MPERNIPLQASHIRDALAAARQHPRTFGADEMDWLGENFGFMKVKIGDVFGHAMRGSKEVGEAVMAGSLLANYAVRLCTGEDGFDQARRNFHRNMADDYQPVSRLRDELDSWSDEAKLLEVFDNPEIDVALHDIKHPSSRTTAAVTLIYLCFDGLPEIDSESVK